ncbi:unnamed protein product [Thelazia callipaeda]|uniref:Zf-C3H1 domain-containing protein n=1 Tax=Thelazia callipaeda TaxID=103827 RepID=A0A0N5D6V4_THECL|nr:unnamed protein product [Thelazia callipaeda]
MIGRSGLFTDIMCPYDDDCSRPHCHFWHTKDDVSQQQESSLSFLSLPHEQPFVGYVGYVEMQAAAPVYYQSIYAPLDPVICSRTSSKSITQDSASHLNSDVIYIPTKIAPSTHKRTPSPEITKPKMPVELPVNEILDPSNDKPKTYIVPSTSGSSLVENTKYSEMSLNDYAKSVADIDTRIEKLQRKIEIERKQKEKIVHDIRALVKPGAVSSSARKQSVSSIMHFIVASIMLRPCEVVLA